MSVLEKLVRLFAPHTCMACGAEDDALLCADCLRALPPAESRCYRCQRPVDDYAVCIACQTKTPIRAAVVAVPYMGHARELIHRMKYERAQAGVRELAYAMTDLLHYLPSDAVLVPVPTATSRVRMRGYDHTALLVRHLSRGSGLPYARALTRTGQAHQVGTDRTHRRQQLRRAFRLSPGQQVQGRHVILVDDVITTGASVEAAAQVLTASGAASVSVVAFAQA